MSRKPPTNPRPPEVKKRERADLITETRSYKLITPLYGGGVEPNEADPVTVVRATEVRGHLRFWWRATRGGDPKFGGDLDEMRKREEEIWGSAAGKDKPGPSKVMVIVSVTNRGKKFQAINRYGKPVRNIGHYSSKDSYIAFPLREEDDPILLESVEFTLKIQYCKKHKSGIQDELQAALWAWEAFGGIGARTRRGFGALKRIDSNALPAPTPQGAKKWLEDGLDAHVVKNGQWPAGVPHLSQNLTIKTSRQLTNAVSAWRYLVEGLKNFRQQRRKGTQQNRPGRSYWPEAEAIRDKTGKRDHKHAPLPDGVDKFPRAKFGLPIIFQFKDNNDPGNTTLQGKNHDRLASPLILRPIACSDGAVGLAAILEWEPVDADEPYTPPGGLRITGEGLGQQGKKVESKLDKSEAANIPPLKGDPDVLKAFLKFLK